MVLNTFCCQVHLLYKFKDYVQRIHIHQTAAILDPNTTEKKIQTGVWRGDAKEYRMGTSMKRKQTMAMWETAS
jgi:hypothetical protein